MYTIYRKYRWFDYGEPLGDSDECFIFDRKEEAEKCLCLCFHNGENFNDEKYGMCRCYVDTYETHYTPIIY